MSHAHPNRFQSGVIAWAAGVAAVVTAAIFIMCIVRDRLGIDTFSYFRHILGIGR